MITTINEYKLFLESKTKSIKVYHGTDNKFEDFDLQKSYDGGIWFTDSLESINNHATGGTGNKIIMTRYITLNNPAGWDEYDKYSVDQLINIGYDSVVLPTDDIIDYFVLDLNCISKTPINESNTNTINFKVFDKDEFYKYLWRTGEFDVRFKNKMDGGQKVFKYMQLDTDMRGNLNTLDVINNLKEVYFFGLEVNDIIVALAHIRRSPYIENTYWLSYLCVDPLYESQGYASKLSESMFKWYKEHNLQFESSSYTERGYITLKPLFNRLAKQYNVPFIDKEKF